MLYTVQQLNEVIEDIVKDNEGNDFVEVFAQGWNKEENKFDNESDPILHHILDSYHATKKNQDKKNLRTLLDKILNLGADPNITNADGMPLLHKAIEMHANKFTKNLLKSDRIDYEIQDADNNTALEVCLIKWPKNTKLMKLLSNRTNNIQTRFLNLINDYLVNQNGRYKTKIKLLIENKLINFNAPDKYGLLPLHLCSIGNLEFFNFILASLEQEEIQINFSQQDRQGNTALHLACNKWNNPNLEIIKQLLDKGIDGNLTNKLGETAAHIAIENNDINLIQLLLKSKVDFSMKDSLGRTPLIKMLTCPEFISNVQTIQLLSQQQRFLIFQSDNVDPVKLAYEKGFWIRQIAAYKRDDEEGIEREASILSARENYSTQRLTTHNPPYNIKINPELSYSPATFVKANIPVKLFRPTGYGMIIQTDNLISSWASGLAGEVKTDNMEFNQKKLEFIYPKDHQCQNKHTNEIRSFYQKLYKHNMHTTLFTPLQRYESSSKSYMNYCVGYNEALFRYTKQEIIAFYCSENPKDIFYALKLRSDLNLEKLQLYTYQFNGTITFFGDTKARKLAQKFDPIKEKSAKKKKLSKAVISLGYKG